MRERERHAQERRDTRKYFYELACEIADQVLSLPMIQSKLEFSLRFLKLTREEQENEFKELIELNASRCVYGEPEMGITPEFQCNYLIGNVDLVAHARPALEHAITLHRESGKPLPKQLREWEPSSAQPKRRGPRPQVQDATALRDHVIALAVSAVVDVQEAAEWPVRLSIGQAKRAPKSTGYSICYAVLDVLTRRYGDNSQYLLPTYNVVRNAWRRYEGLDPRAAGRLLLPTQGVKAVMHPPDGSGEPFHEWLRREAASQFPDAFDEMDAESPADAPSKDSADS